MRAIWPVMLGLLGGCTYDFGSFSLGDGGAVDGASETSGDAPAGGCSEAGGKVLLGRCYFPTASAASWDATQKSCEATGAHLLTITSVDEQLAASGVGSGDRWIGLSQSSGSAPFAWITGEPVGFTRWGGGKPTGAGRCAYMDGGAVWRDRACTDALVGICER